MIFKLLFVICFIFYLEKEKDTAVLNWARERFLLFMSDAGSENIKFCANLRSVHDFTKLEHVTCANHALHNIAKLLPTIYEKPEKLMKLVTNIYCRAPNRRNQWCEQNEFTKIKLPPQPCVTRFLTWVECATWYAESKNRDALVKAMEELEAEKKSKRDLKEKIAEVL